jgi:hypothetical protein
MADLLSSHFSIRVVIGNIKPPNDRQGGGHSTNKIKVLFSWLGNGTSRLSALLIGPLENQNSLDFLIPTSERGVKALPHFPKLLRHPELLASEFFSTINIKLCGTSIAPHGFLCLHLMKTDKPPARQPLSQHQFQSAIAPTCRVHLYNVHALQKLLILIWNDFLPLKA